MFLMLIVAILFLAGAIYNFSLGVYSEALAGVAIAFLLTVLFFFSREQESRIEEFLIWLLEHKDKLKTNRLNAITWQGVPIRYDTVVTQYPFCTSFLIVSFKQSSRFFFQSSSDRSRVRLATVLVTLIFGWWGLPLGPFYTLQTLVEHLRGGNKRLIGDIIIELESGANKP
ncbi:hypothetical protein [Motiliproteus sp. MSK22-1]|uniref:hypothetical protein n=1 Tax=Motiliproteus sp. MSK22-1 TaxID=1897630 RepID=UPI000976A0BC|nr:hypothetical protein [Motiliproteus sp. MSK22-1]OMH39509.1 hypothetical protein BGP75_02650 [Motiliproteus sp. MSK22-1]